MGDHVTVSGGTGHDGASVPGYFSGGSGGGAGRGSGGGASGSGGGVLVIPSEWGLTAHVVDVVERVAAAGFSALAVDLYRGRTATGEHEAAALAGALEHGAVVAELSQAVDHLIDVTAVHRVGVVGYGLGGGLALELAVRRPDAVVAVAPYYGLVGAADALDWDGLDAKVVGEFAELDETSPPDAAAALQEDLRSRGKDVTINVHRGVGPGFFNDARHDVYAAEPAIEAWERTLALFREQLVDD